MCTVAVSGGDRTQETDYGHSSLVTFMHTNTETEVRCNGLSCETLFVLLLLYFLLWQLFHGRAFVFVSARTLLCDVEGA